MKSIEKIKDHGQEVNKEDVSVLFYGRFLAYSCCLWCHGSGCIEPERVLSPRKKGFRLTKSCLCFNSILIYLRSKLYCELLRLYISDRHNCLFYYFLEVLLCGKLILILISVLVMKNV